MPPQNETVDTLAAKIKAKYPQYGQVDNQQLVSKIIAKYPQYKSALAPGALGPSTPATQNAGGGVTGSWDEGEAARSLGIPETQAPKGVYQHITQIPFPGPINESVNAFANRSEWEVAHGNPVRAALYAGVAGATHDMSGFLSPLSVGSVASTGALSVLGDLATDAAVASKAAPTVQEAEQAATRARNLGSAYKTLSTVSKTAGAGLAASQVPTLVSPNSTVPQRLGAAGMVIGGALPFAMPSDQDILAAQATQKYRNQAGPSAPATGPEAPSPQPLLPNIAPQVAEPARTELAPEPETLLSSPKPAPSASGLPELAPAEHAEQEAVAGRPLTTDEAHAQRIRQVQSAIMGKMLAGEKPTDIVQQTRQAADPAARAAAIAVFGKSALEAAPAETPKAEPTPAEIVAGKNGPEQTTTLPPAPAAPAPIPKIVGPVALPRDVENLRDQMNFHGTQGRRTDLAPAQADAHMQRAKALSKQIGQRLDAYSAQLSPSQRSELADTLASRATRAKAQAGVINTMLAEHPAAKEVEKTLRAKLLDPGTSYLQRQEIHKVLGDKMKLADDERGQIAREKLMEVGKSPDYIEPEAAARMAEAKTRLADLRQKFQDAVSEAARAGFEDPAEAQKQALFELGGKDYLQEVRALQDDIKRGAFKEVYAGKAPATAEKPLNTITAERAQALLGTKKHVGAEAAIPRLTAKAKQLELDAAQYGAFAKRLTRQSGSVSTAPRPYIQTGEYNLNPAKLEATAKRQPNLVWKITDKKPAGEYGWISPDGKYFVSAMKETHDIALTHALGFKDSSAPDASVIYDQAHQEGWVRKAYAGEYSTGHLTPQSLDVMNNDMLLNLPKLDNNAPITIDEVNHTDSAAVGGSNRINSRLLSYNDYLANDFDLGKTIQDYDRRYSMRGQRGAGGSEILAGMAAGGLAGAASGHPLVAAAGAIAGGLVPAAARTLGPELTDIARSVSGHVGDTYNAITHFLSPKTGVSRDTLDAIYQMKGGIDAANYMAAASLKAFRKTFDAMPDADRIDFIDRFKQGKEQPTPELQGIANTIRQMDKEDHNLLTQYNPSVPFMENHFRLLYKKLPGGDENKFTGFMGRRPLQGTRGFMKQHTFEDLSSAMAEGGVPVTTNPVDMWLMAHADVMRYVHTQKLWDWAQDSGARKFVKKGEPIPDGYTRLNDNLAKVYFPAKSGEGLVNPGEWVVEEGFGRLLNNYLSRDYIRGNILGKSLLDLKNVTSAWNLFGPFHAVKMSGMAIANDLNLGTRALQSGDVIEGLKQYLGAAGAPVRTFLEGRNLQKMMEDRNKFLQSDGGQAFIKAYPNAEQLLDDAFHGGLRLDISPDYKVDMLKSALENFHNGKYISGALKMPAAMIYTAMKPLFEHYIPSLKAGAFMRDMSAALIENADALASGSKTRSEVARGVVDRIDNAFGQINFDNLFWQKTMKSLAQLEYTSVTWRLGNMRLTRDALVGQLRDFNNARKTGSVPKMNPNLGLLLHEGLLYGLAGAAITYLMAHKRPQSVKDLVRPQIGGVDTHGKPLRVNLPAYASRDIPQLLSNPISYAAGGQAALLARGAEVLRNKDFYNQEIRNPDDPKMKQFWEMLSHLMPPNLTQRNMQHLLEEGAPRKEAMLGVVGAYPASSRTDMTSAEIEAQSRAARYYSAGPRTSEAVSHGQAISRAVAMMRNNSPALNATLRQDIMAGRLSIDDMDKIQERATTPYLTQLASTPGMTLNDLLAIAQKGNPSERQELLPLIVGKLDQMDNLPPAQQQKISNEIKVLAHSH